MVMGSAPVGPEGGHMAGRRLLEEMYQKTYGEKMPRIAIAPGGKPYFENSPVHFSISHTPRHVFCVLSETPVGIDAEEKDRLVKAALAKKVLSPAEYARYEKAEDPHAALLRLWVLKEASLKATGQGLRGYPNHTDFDPEDCRVRELEDCYVAVIRL